MKDNMAGNTKSMEKLTRDTKEHCCENRQILEVCGLKKSECTVKAKIVKVKS